MPRKMIDCRDYPGPANCSILIAGEKDEVVQAAAEHVVSVHGEQDSKALREKIAKSLKDEPIEYSPPSSRQQEERRVHP